MFRYNFLGHFLAELIEICCGSLLNSILKTYRRKFLKTLWIFFDPNKSEMSNFVFSHKKWLKMKYSTKLKHSCTFLHLYVFYVCATFHCIWRSGFEIMYLGECPKIGYGHHFHGNQPREIFLGFFLPIFHTDHNKYTMKWLCWKISKTVSRPAPTPLNAWYHCGTKMVQFRLNNSPSKYSSTSPYLVSSERAISILSLTYFTGKTFIDDEGFRPPSSCQAAIRTSLASLIGRMSWVFRSQFWQIQTVYFKAVFSQLIFSALSLFKVSYLWK